MRIHPFAINNRTKKEKILIYGASIGGEILLWILKKNQIDVWGICDRAKYGQEFCGYTVMRPEEALKENNLAVIVTTTRAFNSVMQFLDNYIDIKVYEISDLVRGNDIIYDEISYDRIEIEDYKKKYKYYVNEYQNEDEIILPTLDVVVSEVCNLNCRDCSVLVPYLPKRNTYDYEKIISDFRQIALVVDHIVELVIVGGEPFIYKNLDKLLYFFVEQEYIDEVSVVSNGTILPNQIILEALKLDKVRVRISDYNSELQKIENLKTLFENNNINYYIQKLDFWIDMGKPIKRNYEARDLSELFRDCSFSKSQVLVNGKIFRCVHAAEIENYGDFPIRNNEDYIEIRENNGDYNQLKRDLKRYLFDIDSLSLCDYCNGVRSNEKGIKPAIQLERNLKV